MKKGLVILLCLFLIPVLNVFSQENNNKTPFERMMENKMKKMKEDKAAKPKGYDVDIAIYDPKIPPDPEITEPIWFFDPRADKILAKVQIFPKNNPWNEDISALPVAKNSGKMIELINQINHLEYNLDMGFVIVPPNLKKVYPASVGAPEVSEPGPYPIPENIPIEGWPVGADLKPTLEALKSLQAGGRGDRHAMCLDPVNKKLYEFYQMKFDDGGWSPNCVSIFDLTSNKTRVEYSGCKSDRLGLTSTDAAGLPVMPAAARYDEFLRGEITHALRFTVRNSRDAYVWPATHFASNKTDLNFPRMGERFRLRSTFVTKNYHPQAKVILDALKKYGMFMADNGGDWRISITPDPRWSIKQLNTLRQVGKNNFEVIVPTGPNEGPRAGEDNTKVDVKPGQAGKKKKKKKEAEE